MQNQLLSKRKPLKWLLKKLDAAPAKIGLLAALMLTSVGVTNSWAQLTGTKTIPGDYASISAAITDLNTAGVGAGGVTFNIAAGYTETASNLIITATGTSANPIIFQKSGTGANPTITAGVGTSTSLDGIIKLSGTDYITFDGLTLTDAATNTTTTTQMEWGFAVLKTSNTDASQFVTIKNCVITLQKTNTATVGIYSANHTPASTTTLSTTGMTAAGGNSNNKYFNNTISNVYTGIALTGTSTSGFYDLNNEVGVGGANNITNYGGGSSTAYGINTIYQDGLKIANNVINGGTGTTTTLYGILNSTATNANGEIYNNTITIAGGATSSSIYGINNGGGGSGTNNLIKIYGNTIQNSTYTTATSGTFYGIYNSASLYNIDIYNNTVKAINKPGTGTFYGIYQFGNVVNNENIYSNTITDINSTGTGTFYLIYSNATSTTKSAIYGNTLRDISAGTSTLYGISSASTATSNIYNNNIYNLAATSASAIVYGVNYTGGTANYVYNNFISELKTPASTSSDAIRGISAGGGTATGIFYNTIYLNAVSSSATTFGTSAVYASTSPTVDMRNNIIVNVSTPGTTGGLTAAYRRSSTTLTTYASTSNNNLFYAGTPSANQVIFSDGTNNDQTLGAYKTRVSPRDAASVTGLPPFLNVTTSPYNLHISTTTPTQVEGTATPITTPIAITTDIDGNTRNTTTPDMGADEGNFMPQDLTPPAIVYTPLSNTFNTTTDRVITATISDPSGVASTGSLTPRIYYKKNNGTYISKAGVLNAGTWTFTITMADLAPLAAGDVVSYYILAQDMASPSNVGSSPSGAVATDVNTVTTQPTSPATFVILTSYAGTLNVGTGQTITSLTNAGGLFDLLNTNALGGNLTVNITSDLTAETGTFALNQWAETGAGNYTLTIMPSAATNRTISGSFAGGLIRLNGADRVTIDGNFGGSGRFLTFANTNTTASNSAAIQVISLGAGLGAVNNTIKNTNIAGGSNSVTSTFGLYVGSATISTSGTGADNNGLTVQNNVFTNAYIAIFARGVSSTGLLTGLNINNNTIGSNTATEYVTFRGVDIQNVTAPVISGNTIFNLQLATSVNNSAIEIGQNSADAQILRNRIYGIRSTSSGGWGSYGINISSGTGNSNLTIANNMISDIVTSNYSSSSTTYNPFGIRITGGTNLKIYYNTVYLFGSPTTGTSASMSAPMVITSSSVTGLDIRNNIFANTMTGLSGTKTYAIYAVSGTTFGTINYNDYFAPIVGYLGADKTSLAEWQGATTQDANSKNVNPDFVSTTDLHISAFDLNNTATPIPGITTDFDGDVRSTTTPDIGADEFIPVAVDISASALYTPSVKSCYGTEPVAFSIRNVGSAPIDFSTKTVTVTSSVSGAATQTFNTVTVTNAMNGGIALAPGAAVNVTVGTLNMSAPGTYTFNASVAMAGDAKSSNDAIVPADVVVLPVAAGTAAVTQTSLCQTGTPTFNLTGSTGGDIQWQSSTSATGPFTNITGAVGQTYTPTTAITQTGYYQAVVSCGTNNATSNVLTVTVNNPLVASAPAVALCGPGTANLTATPTTGANIEWFTTATGGTAVASGNTYAPAVTSTTTFYAEASSGVTEKVGRMYTAGTDGTNTGGGLIFNATMPFTLDSVVVYSTSATGGSLVVNLTNSAGTVLQTATVTLPGVTGKTAIVVPLNFSVPVGTGLKLVQGSSLALYRDYSTSAGIAFPYTSPSQLFSITDGTLAGYYYFFYRWSVSTKCTATSRTPVVVTVNSPAATPTVTAAGATTFCSGGSVTLTAASTTTGATYQWFNNAVAISGATSATYTANAAGVYTVVATATGCPSAASTATTVTVNAAPAIPTITLGAGSTTTICQGTSAALTGASSTSGATYTWFLNGSPITGATAATYNATAAGSYTVTATNASGCTATSTATVITVTPAPTTPTISQNGGTLTSSAATGNQWYLNGVLIPGATGATYVTAANGNYTVVVTSNGCSSPASAVKTVTNTGVGANLAGMSVAVYPNPATGSFNVKLNGYQKDATVVLYNLAGQQILKGSVAADGNAKNINIKGLAAGTYLLKVTSDKGVQVTRIIVQ